MTGDFSVTFITADQLRIELKAGGLNQNQEDHVIGHILQSSNTGEVRNRQLDSHSRDFSIEVGDEMALLRGLGSSLRQGHYVVFVRKTLCSQLVAHHPTG